MRLYRTPEAVLERCLVDLAVFSPERLDYVAGALIDQWLPFYQDRPAPELHPGKVIDLDVIPAVTAEERAQYTAMVAEAYQAAGVLVYASRAAAEAACAAARQRQTAHL